MEARRLLILFLAIITLAIASVLILNPAPVKPATTDTGPATISQEQVLERLSTLPEVKPFAASKPEVTLLTPELLQQLKTAQPVIYGNVPPGTYRVVYNGNASALVVYDFFNNKILKIYSIQNLVLE